MYKYGLTKTAQEKPAAAQDKKQLWKRMLPYIVGATLGGSMGALSIPVFGGQWKTSTVLPMAGLGALAGAGLGGLTTQTTDQNTQNDSGFLKNTWIKLGGDPETYDKIVNTLTPSSTTMKAAVGVGVGTPLSIYTGRNIYRGVKTGLTAAEQAAKAAGNTLSGWQRVGAGLRGAGKQVSLRPVKDVSRFVLKHPKSTAGFLAGLVALIAGFSQ